MRFVNVKKENGGIEKFDADKLKKSIVKVFDKSDYTNYESHVEAVFSGVIRQLEEFPGVFRPTTSQLGSIIEDTLVYLGHPTPAKNYILYRDHKHQMSNLGNKLKVDVKELTDNYLLQRDWRLKENSNFNFSVGGLEFYQSGALSAKYWLESVYPKHVSQAHVDGDIHICDLSRLTSYCSGFEITKLLKEGLVGVGTNLSSKPAKHLRSVINQLINFIGIESNEFSGAVAVNNISTMLAPFIKADNMSFLQVKQDIQNFVFSLGIPSRFSGQSLTYDQNITVFDKLGDLHVVPIGEFVEDYDNFKEFSTVSFNTTTGEVSKNKITGVIKHHTKGDIYKVTLVGGNDIKITEDHSLFSIDDNLNIVEATPTTGLKHVLVPQKINCDSSTAVQEIVFTEDCGRKNKGLKLLVAKDVSWLLGLYVADGNINGSAIEIATYNEVLYDEVCQISKDFASFRDASAGKGKLPKHGGIRLNVGRNVSFTLEKMCGHGAYNKRIPDVIFSSPTESKISFLSGLIDGDGTIDKKHKCAVISTVSAELVSGILYLCMQLGIKTSVRKKVWGTNSFNPGGEIFCVHILAEKNQVTWDCRHPDKKNKISACGGNKDTRHDFSFLSPTLAKIFKSSKVSKFSFIGKHKISNVDLSVLEEYANNTLASIDNTDFNNIESVLELCQILYIPASTKKGFDKETFKRNNTNGAFYKHKNFVIAEIDDRRELLLKLKRVLDVLKHVSPIKVKKVELQRYEPFVYDISVKNNENFLTFNGIIAHNSPFSNVTIDLTIPHRLKNKPAIVGGIEQSFTYGECQEELKVFNRAFFDILLEGDSVGRPFSFPIPTINIDKEFDWNDDSLKSMWEATVKYGYFYFANYINSDLSPEDARSLCCRLKLNVKEVIGRSSGLLGGNSDVNIGSIGVAVVNMPRIGYLSKTREEFFKSLDKNLELCYESLELKRKAVESNLQNGLYPYSKWYLENFNTYFSTVGENGMDECCQNFFGKEYGIGTKEGKQLAMEVMDFITKKVDEFKERSGNLYNHEQVPGEGLSSRLAQVDKKKFPDIITSGVGESVFYTGSTLLPARYTDDLFESLDHQNEIQEKYSAGCLRKGTKVLTKIGGVEIDKIVETVNNGGTFEVLSYNTGTELNEWKPVTKGHVMDVSSCKKFRIKTEGGVSIDSADWHVFFKRNRDEYIFTGGCPVCGKELTNVKALAVHLKNNKGCHLEYKRHECTFSTSEARCDELKAGDYILQTASNSLREPVGGDFDKDLMWLVGFFIGDGCLSSVIDNRGGNSILRHSVRFFSEHTDVMNKCKRILLEKFGVDLVLHKGKSSGPKCWIIAASSKKVCEFFINLGFPVGEKCYTVRVTDALMGKINSENVFGLLSGLLDSDGHIAKRDGAGEYISVSSGLIEDISEVLALAGIKSGVHSRLPSRKNEKRIYRLSIPSYELIRIKDRLCFLNNIDSIYARGGERMNRMQRATRIKSIEEIETENEFFDLTVEDNNNYLAGNNGFLLVHNCVEHVFVGETLGVDMVKKLVKTIFTNYTLPYISITPTYSVCSVHNYIAGEHSECPRCKKELAELDKRIKEEIEKAGK